MPYKDSLGRTCGFLNIEEKEGSGRFVRRYFLLDKLNGQLIYYLDNPSNLAEGNRTALGGISLQLVSMVSDGKSLRPKLENCFVINHLNKKYYLQAEGENDKKEWIEVLNNASKIFVPPVDKDKDECQEWHYGDTSSGYTAQLAGGVVCKVAIKDNSDDSSSSDSDDDSAAGFTEVYRPPIKTGFCVKQGALRKNWKRRYFVLNKQSISYYRTDSEKSPLKSIPLTNISDVRPSTGSHSNRDNLFEIITSKRTFYVQCDTKEDMFSWIEEIQKQLSSRLSSGSGKYPVAGGLQLIASNTEKVKPEAKVVGEGTEKSCDVSGTDTDAQNQVSSHQNVLEACSGDDRKQVQDMNMDNQTTKRDNQHPKKEKEARRSKNWFW